MKNTPLILLTLLVTCLIAFASCSKDSAGLNCTTGFNLYGQIADELQTLNTTTLAYSQDPTTENCEAYKNALSDYIDALQSYEKCAREAGQLDDYRNSLNDAQDDIDDIEC